MPLKRKDSSKNNEQANLLLIDLSQYLRENGLLEKAYIPAKAGTSHQPTPKQVKTYSQHEVIRGMSPRTSPQPKAEEGISIKDEVRDQIYQHFQTIGVGIAPPRRNVGKQSCDSG